MISNRLKFTRKGAQAKFIANAKTELKLSWRDLARVLGVNVRTLTDWAREKYNMSHEAAKKIEAIAGYHPPLQIKIVSWKNHLSGISRSGGNARFKKYGSVVSDEKKRQLKWREWWEREGRYRPSSIHNTPKSIKKPPASAKLAEFVGIMLGDGSITKYQVRITHHRYDDRSHTKFVIQLLKNLFAVEASIIPRKDALAEDISISRIELVNFCVSKLGLVPGHKIRHKIDIPDWIKKNVPYSIACLRGLVDTDGCVVIHKYKINNKQYTYKKLMFTSRSEPLRESVYNILHSLDLKPRMSRKYDVWLDSKESVSGYFTLVGSNNSKHLNRYKGQSMVKSV